MREYDSKQIEEKWREIFEKSAPKASDSADKKKTYLLVEFPFPSGEGLHVGHVRGYTALDVVARKRRRQGENVLYPIGWDAFGLPTENYAIKVGRDPREVTKENTDNYRAQMKRLALSFDWEREVNTTDPAYYRFTQWIFLQLFKHDLAYKSKVPINWCPKDKIGLANEEVVDGKCERCGTEVEKREREQWMLAITKYAERLYDDLDTVDYIERAKAGQRNWIGKSEGAEIRFQVLATGGEKKEITVFTTRPDTIFGATYIVLAPEHPLVQSLVASHESIKNREEILRYIEEAKNKEEMERTAEGKEKTGVRLEGITAINPANNEEIPVYVADYVLGSYGTGAVMAVPAHDERDFAFAQKFNLPMRQVVAYQEIGAGIHQERAGLETLNRRTVDAIIHDTMGNFYLLKDGDHVHLVGGGVEDGEDLLTAVRREVIEETGFTDFEVNMHSMTSMISCHGYRHTKNKNQRTLGPAIEIILNSTERSQSEVEEGRHELIVVSKDKLISTITWPHHKKYAEFYVGGQQSYTGEGILLNSEQFDGLASEDARKKITEAVGGTWTTKYKLRDWVFSRQRYWGEPIPMVNCESCGWVPVSESDLPVELPHVERYEPTDTGDSPLANMDEWVNTTCPSCGGNAKRETDVMPNWAGSSWYYLRYCDPKNAEVLADKKKLEHWLPVDWYNGGMEHTTLHLLYSRFWHKFLYDIGVVPTSEPYQRRTSHGLILAEGGEKMSKSKGNVVNPDDIIERFGADALRTYEMFMGPFDQAIAWSTDGLVGVRRFLERVARLQERVEDVVLSPELETILNQTIKKVGEDIEALRMNTAVSQLMILTNAIEKETAVSRTAYTTLLLLLAPFAPFLTEELWESMGNTSSVHEALWPTFDSDKLVEAEVVIAIQVNGKVRGTITCSRDTEEATVLALARGEENIEKWLNGKDIAKIVYIKNKVLNLVVREG